MLYLLTSSSIAALTQVPSAHLWRNVRGIYEKPNVRTPEHWLRARLAVPQLLLAVAAFTSFHVQIITRLSSGYPLWYLHIAQAILGFVERLRTSSAPNRSGSPVSVTKPSAEAESEVSEDSSANPAIRAFVWMRPELITRFMIMYALIQGSLFASFLPPA
jgi:GPI mannosyltransferase 2